MRMVKRGDILSLPIWIDKPIASDEESADQCESDSDSEVEASTYLSQMRNTRKNPTALAYFQVTALSYEPLTSLEEDFRSSISSKARAGELGCWVNIGQHGSTRMVLTGVERSRISRRREHKSWYGLGESGPPVCPIQTG